MVDLSKIARKKRQLKIIRSGVLAGKSGRTISSELKEKNLGVRNKYLYDEIRSYKGILPSKKRQVKKKQTKIISTPEKDFDRCYRMTFIIRDIPLHSHPLRRNYFGFHIFAFAYNQNHLLDNENFLIKELKRLTSKYTGGHGYGLRNIDDHPANTKVYIEKPVEVYFTEAKRYNRRYIFRIERNGAEEYTEEGEF